MISDSSKKSCLNNFFCKLGVFLAILAMTACSAKKSSKSIAEVADKNIASGATESLLIPGSCKDVSRYISDELGLEKYRMRYQEVTLQALVDLTICLNREGYVEQSSHIGLEALLLADSAQKEPNDIYLVSQIVSESPYHSYAIRAWADWTYISSITEDSKDVTNFPTSATGVRSRMVTSRRVALSSYFEQFKGVEHE